MAQKVLAAVTVNPQKTEIQEFDMPDVPDDAGLLRIEAAGVCGSDYSSYGRMKQGPRIMGHENVGIIEKIGPIAARRWGVREGDRVLLEEYLPCGFCHSCRTGDFRLCLETDLRFPNAARYGTTPISVSPSLWGGFSQYMYLPPNAVLHKLPKDVPAHLFAYAIPFSNGIQWAFIEGGVSLGQTVVIQGPGQQGVSCVIAAKDAGASCIIVTGLTKDKKRLEIAREFGADYTINVEEENLQERVEEIIGKEMADVVIDVTPGAAEPIRTALELVKIRGTVVLAGTKHKPIDGFYSDRIARKYLTVKGGRGHSFHAVELAVKLIASGKYPFEKLCTHQFGLSDVDKAIRAVGGEGVEGAIHVTVDPWRM